MSKDRGFHLVNRMTTSEGMKSSRISLNRVALPPTETDQAYIKMTDPSGTFGFYSNSGTPEGVVTANPGSICSDTTSSDGKLYIKNTGTGNTGWVQNGTTGTAVGFFAYLNTTIASTTAGKLIPFNATRFNEGSGLDTGTGIFTAPVAGKYSFQFGVTYSGVIASHTTMNVSGVLSAQDNIQTNNMNAENVKNAGNALGVTGSFTVQMALGETLSINAFILGATAYNLVGNDATFNDFTYFSGHLVNQTITSPPQTTSAFSARIGTTLSNVTGDGTTVNPIIYDIETFDLNGDYDNTTGIFTAPVAGLYYITCNMQWEGLTASHNDAVGQIVFGTSIDTQQGLNAGLIRRPSTAFANTFSRLVQLAASETVQVATTVSGGALVVDLVDGGGSVEANSFSAVLINETIPIADQTAVTPWTPNLAFGGASVGLTYGLQKGLYVKTGKLVHVHIDVTITAVGSSVGNAEITNLPFPVANSVNYNPVFIGLNGTFTGIPAGYTNIVGVGTPGASTIAIQIMKIDSGGLQLGNANFQAGTQFIFECSYMTD